LKTEELNEIRYKDKTDALDKLTKNIQLLSGEETDKVGHSVKVEFV